MINCIKSTSFPKILKNIYISHYKICANVIRKATFRLMVTLDLKCQVNIVASKIPAISKSKPPCFFLICYSLIVLIFNSKTSVFNPKLCISLKYFMCTSITGNCNADFLTRSIRLWGVYAAPAMSCKVARRSKKIALRLPTEQWGFVSEDR